MSPAGPPVAPREPGRRRPLVIAHRGASAQRPENTLPAYALAVEQGADMIEIDLHVTRDGAIVVTHDEQLEGLGGRGEIADATFAEVRALDAGDGERVPTLDEVLDAFGERIAFNLELKRGSRGEYEGLETRAVAAVRRRGILDRTLFSSFYDPVLAALRAEGDDVRIGTLVSPRAAAGWLERSRDVDAEAVHFWLGLATPEAVVAAHDAGLAVHVYTVDEVDAMRALLDRGVDGLFTNHPDRMLALLRTPPFP